MSDVEHEIERLQVELRNAQAVIDAAIRDRRASGNDTAQKHELNAAIAQAREALAVVEMKLRKLYETKGDD